MITYSVHAELKIASRKIRRQDVEKVVDTPEERYEDTEHDAKVAIGSTDGASLVVIYRVVNTNIKVITFYHARKIEKLISSKTKRSAWRRIR